MPEENATRPVLILEPSPLSRNGLVVAVPTQNRFALTVVHYDSVKLSDQYVFERYFENDECLCLLTKYYELGTLEQLI